MFDEREKLVVVGVALAHRKKDRRQHNDSIFSSISVNVCTAGVGKTNWSGERKILLEKPVLETQHTTETDWERLGSYINAIHAATDDVPYQWWWLFLRVSSVRVCVCVWMRWQWACESQRERERERMRKTPGIKISKYWKAWRHSRHTTLCGDKLRYESLRI